jgi:hypothetical protein
MEPVYTEKYRGLTIEIYQDDGNGLHPRQDCDNLTQMVCFHRRYDLGDKHEYTPESLQEAIKAEHIEAMPLFLYDHSGISISCRSFIGRAQHAEWDSGQIGFIFISRAVILENWPKCKQWRKQAREVMESDVKVYDQYIRGNIYGFKVGNEAGKEIDSCWGYIGDYDDKGGILDEVKANIDRMTHNGTTDSNGQQVMSFAVAI